MAQEEEEKGGEIAESGEAEGGDLLPPGGWFPFFVIAVSLGFAFTFSKWLEKKDTPGGAYGVVEH